MTNVNKKPHLKKPKAQFVYLEKYERVKEKAIAKFKVHDNSLQLHRDQLREHADRLNRIESESSILKTMLNRLYYTGSLLAIIFIAYIVIVGLF